MSSPTSLAQRLSWVTALRVLALSLLLLLTGFLHLPDAPLVGAFSGKVILGTLAAAFAVAAAQATLLRRERHLRAVAYSQILADQVTWTLLAYVSGGVASGATSFYGLTCLLGAVVDGVAGVVVAALVGLGLLTLMCAGFASGLLGPPPDQRGIYLRSWEDLSFPFSQAVLATTVSAVLAGYLAERLRRTGGQLEQAQERAERAERLALLGRFAAGLAHEIRNPLGAISGSVDLLASAPSLSEEDRLLCGIISREASRLNDLVSDMLELARPRKPELAPVDLGSVAAEVVRLSSQSGRGVDVGVRFEGPAEPITVQADAAQLRQVLWNLVRNAIQASSAGSAVVVRVHKTPEGTTLLDVQDHGRGIDGATLAQLFDAFFTTRTNGVGVGLAVVKRIVEDHGWRIEVQSQEGHGALFRVVIG